MTTRPWMPLYIADYRADTAHLSACEHGAYLLLIMHYWQTGGLPPEDAQLARIACMSPSEWKRSRPTIYALFTDGWKHKRIEVELKRTAEVSEAYAARASHAAKSRWSKHATSNATSNATSMQEECLGMPISQSQSQKKEKEEDAPDGASSKYFFESGVIRLSEKDFRKWKEAFSNLDLRAELLGLTQWAEQQKDWFYAVSGALAKRNREIGIAIKTQPQRPEARVII